jgi:hypothetical protein
MAGGDRSDRRTNNGGGRSALVIAGKIAIAVLGAASLFAIMLHH